MRNSGVRGEVATDGRVAWSELMSIRAMDVREGGINKVDGDFSGNTFGCAYRQACVLP